MPDSFGDALFRYVAGRVAPYLIPPPPAFDFEAAFQRLEKFMADTQDLITRLDADLAAFNQDRTDRDALDALRATADAAHAAALADLRTQIDALTGDNAALKAELEKIAGQLEAAHAAVPPNTPPPGGVTTEPSTG